MGEGKPLGRLPLGTLRMKWQENIELDFSGKGKSKVVPLRN
jgi:hypothetical protein